MLTLNWADGSCVGCGGQASWGGQLVAGPVLTFVANLGPKANRDKCPKLCHKFPDMHLLNTCRKNCDAC